MLMASSQQSQQFFKRKINKTVVMYKDDSVCVKNVITDPQIETSTTKNDKAPSYEPELAHSV